ncbi:glycerate kinase [Zeaxanthinibacter sp. PT1]|uniref:glycerate kinase n=1 Tax=Zeaxanthinibacter TaxID=561554 RepID=UPI002349E710|nr:glycerate kinase [Zeaxanthinibacter sp. PT1]MDC6352088.1 glycerate kinase [Zeaxanthinibacter sp. PT1]
MKFVIAPDKYKGSLTAFQICDAVEKGIRLVFEDAEVVKLPLADGGDGTIEVVKHYLKGDKVFITVKDPFGRPVKASYLYSTESKTAFIEMAEASGLKLLEESEKDCLQTTTIGTGELLVDAMDKGANKIILGIGGSATNDGGMGMATALGYRFLDMNDRELAPIGINLDRVFRIDTSSVDSRFKSVSIKVACDVSNDFYGPHGAAHVYAAQKGASEEEIELLDKGLRNFASVLKTSFDIDVQEISGSGAAGGVGGASLVFLDAELESGIGLIKDLAGFDEKLRDADWIITGEGKLDEQTLAGKTISGVITSAKKFGIPVAAFCGALNISIENQKSIGLSYAVAILQETGNLEHALLASNKNLVQSVYNWANVLRNK